MISERLKPALRCRAFRWGALWTLSANLWRGARGCRPPWRNVRVRVRFGFGAVSDVGTDAEFCFLFDFSCVGRLTSTRFSAAFLPLRWGKSWARRFFALRFRVIFLFYQICVGWSRRRFGFSRRRERGENRREPGVFAVRRRRKGGGRSRGAKKERPRTLGERRERSIVLMTKSTRNGRRSVASSDSRER